MKCPYCSHKETKVTDKRTSYEGIRRRRECLNSKCEKRFTTYEKIEQIERYVVKKDGRREPFNKDKIYLGIVKACEKRDIGHDKIDIIINEIEDKIQNQKEIKTEKIGEMIMKSLKKLDKVAYIRFASVYRDFEDVSDFNDLMKEVKD